MASVLSLAAELRAGLATFDAALLSAQDCARVAEELAATEKACAAASLLAAARAVSTGAHKGRGYADGGAWLARHSGSTQGEARQALRTAGLLENCPGTKEALLAGQVSVAQAFEVVQSEKDFPGSEERLLEVARGTDVTQLRERAREQRQAEMSPDELRRRQISSREFRHWLDGEGMVRFAGALPPETGLPLVRRVEVTAARLRNARKASGAPERFDAHAADALAMLVAGSSEGKLTKRPARAELVVVCDIFAWRRGHAHPGEVCQIIGGGPIPPDVAKELCKDAFVKAVLHDGARIQTIKHYGRHLRAALRTALDLGPVPEFSGRRCTDCGSRWGLQYDHVNPVANNGPTQYSNLIARCYVDHQEKTKRDREAGLLGPHPPSATGWRRPKSPPKLAPHGAAPPRQATRLVTFGMDKPMPLRHVGALRVSLVGLGCNNFGGRIDEAQSPRVIDAAVDVGINYFDTADVYGATKSEEFLGRALAKRRGDVIIATKFGVPLDAERKGGASPAYVNQALDDSLRRLGTDYIDLFQLHKPDPQTPIADTLGALGELVQAGKVREIGCSNFSAAQLKEAASAVAPGSPRFVSVQNEYSLLHREPELEVLGECERQGIAFVPYFPLHMGILSGKYHQGQAPPEGTRIASMPEERRDALLDNATMGTVQKLSTFAEARGHSILELAIAWLAAKPAVATVIAGATKPEQVVANAQAASWSLSEAEVDEVDSIAPAPS
ncbi:MAG TPA: aldo/keto reductase [Acidimicrobiales bacterium]|nr:aldo/keto reductase [Acidimicrobiales bacterium]